MAKFQSLPNSQGLGHHKINYAISYQEQRHYMLYVHRLVLDQFGKVYVQDVWSDQLRTWCTSNTEHDMPFVYIPCIFQSQEPTTASTLLYHGNSKLTDTVLFSKLTALMKMALTPPTTKMIREAPPRGLVSVEILLQDKANFANLSLLGTKFVVSTTNYHQLPTQQTRPPAGWWWRRNQILSMEVKEYTHAYPEHHTYCQRVIFKTHN